MDLSTQQGVFFFVFQLYTEFYWCASFAVVILLLFYKPALVITLCSNVIREEKLNFENATNSSLLFLLFLSFWWGLRLYVWKEAIEK